MNRVVITGIGVVSPIGLSREEFWTSLCNSRCAIGPITGIENVEELEIKTAAEVKNFSPSEHIDHKILPLLDRFTQFAMVSAKQALKESGLSLTDELLQKTAVVIGSGVGGIDSLDQSFQRIYKNKKRRLHPFTIPRLMMSSCASQVSMILGVMGPTYTLSSACASSNHAIGQAFQMVRTGQVPLAVTGGTDACITFGSMRGWEALRILSPDTCRPFSKDRRGIVLGEGGACFILEPLTNAKQRNAPILAEIVGFGMSTDAKSITTSSLQGMSKAILNTLNNAQLNTNTVDYINAHGTGTVTNDSTETQAIHKVFGGHAVKLMVSSSKSIFGHLIGGSGALELAVTVLALQHGVIPPTLNYLTSDPQCDLDYVTDHPRQVPIKIALSHSFAFGGLNAVLAVKRFE